MADAALVAPFSITAAYAYPVLNAAGSLVLTDVVRNFWISGSGRVAGTVKEAATPSDLPLRRKVRLVDQRSGRIYGEMWSNAATGEYAFENIDETRTYYVISHDHTGNYNAVVKDGITPEAMP